MNIEQQIKECAVMEGYFNLEWEEGALVGGHYYGCWLGNHKTRNTSVPNYDNRDDVLRLFSLLTPYGQAKAIEWLVKPHSMDISIYKVCQLLLRPVSDWREAILRANGVWDE